MIASRTSVLALLLMATLATSSPLRLQSVVKRPVMESSRNSFWGEWDQKECAFCHDGILKLISYVAAKGCSSTDGVSAAARAVCVAAGLESDEFLLPVCIHFVQEACSTIVTKHLQHATNKTTICNDLSFCNTVPKPLPPHAWAAVYKGGVCPGFFPKDKPLLFGSCYHSVIPQNNTRVNSVVFQGCGSSVISGIGYADSACATSNGAVGFDTDVRPCSKEKDSTTEFFFSCALGPVPSTPPPTPRPGVRPPPPPETTPLPPTPAPTTSTSAPTAAPTTPVPTLCPVNDTLCPRTSLCCGAGDSCCENSAYPTRPCCPTTTAACLPGGTGGDVCCLKGAKVCANGCCSATTTCCGSLCCETCCNFASGPMCCNQKGYTCCEAAQTCCAPGWSCEVNRCAPPQGEMIKITEMRLNANAAAPLDLRSLKKPNP